VSDFTIIRKARRGTRPTGCFENEASVTIIIFGAILELKKNWKEKLLKEFTQKN